MVLPFLITRALTKTALLYIQHVITHDFYFDDLLTGGENMQHRTALMKILGSTGMLLGKWADNDQRLMFDNTKKNASGLEIKRSEEDPKKLELCWSSQEDRLRFVTKSSSQARIRKRAILSKVAHIFDPLGLVGPVIARAKLLMKKGKGIYLGTKIYSKIYTFSGTPFVPI